MASSWFLFSTHIPQVFAGRWPGERRRWLCSVWRHNLLPVRIPNVGEGQNGEIRCHKFFVSLVFLFWSKGQKVFLVYRQLNSCPILVFYLPTCYYFPGLQFLNKMTAIGLVSNYLLRKTINMTYPSLNILNIVCLMVELNRILWNKQQMQLYPVNFIPLLGSLYMFRVLYTPIIRSTYLLHGAESLLRS